MADDYLRGHKIYLDGAVWRYADTGEPTVGNRRPCGHCGLPEREDGHDACIGILPGVINACCGHGDDNAAYIQFEDGTVVRGKAAVDSHKRTET